MTQWNYKTNLPASNGTPEKQLFQPGDLILYKINTSQNSYVVVQKNECLWTYNLKRKNENATLEPDILVWLETISEIFEKVQMLTGTIQVFRNGIEIACLSDEKSDKSAESETDQNLLLHVKKLLDWVKK